MVEVVPPGFRISCRYLSGEQNRGGFNLERKTGEDDETQNTR